MKSLSQFMQDIQSTLEKVQSDRKVKIPENKDELLYFAYGHNTASDRFHQYCPGAIFVGVGILKDFSLYFEEYANIRMSEGDNVKGVVWKIKAKQIINLDGYEALHKDYNRIPVEVSVDGGNDMCITYILDPKFETKHIHKKPTEEYVNDVAKGYVEHKIPLDQIKQALKRS